MTEGGEWIDRIPAWIKMAVQVRAWPLVAHNTCGSPCGRRLAPYSCTPRTLLRFNSVPWFHSDGDDEVRPLEAQAPGEIPYNGIYYDPPEEERYKFKYPRPQKPAALRIYECHVGMSSPEPKVSTYLEFARDVIPRAADMGYNAIQLMAIQEHAFYGSFGYHVTNFFAVRLSMVAPHTNVNAQAIPPSR
jgi:hypothetical protein